MSYTITLNERQAGIMQIALETYARLGLYQIDMTLRGLPTIDNMVDYEDQLAIERILSPYKTAWHEKNKTRSEHHDVAWDLSHVIRHRLAWDGAKARGEVREDGQRDWSKQLGVWYDAPSKHSLEPLANIVKTG